MATGGGPELAQMLIGSAMGELNLTILPETADDAMAIERLQERTFGPGRYARSAQRIPPRGQGAPARSCRLPRASARCWSARCG